MSQCNAKNSRETSWLSASRDWYHSAQAVAHSPQSRRSSVSLEDVEEVDEVVPREDEKQANGPPFMGEADDNATRGQQQDQQRAADAAARLGLHESFALITTFAMPALAAYLLHFIRGQLSRPSEGLVSDYNLTIFLLAAEIRPVRQLIRLVTNRTLHLQRLVNDAHDSSGVGSANQSKLLKAMAARLAALEATVPSNGTHSTTHHTQQQELAVLSADMKRRYEPRLDALERAVRRYEKRATTLTLLTEQRLQSLESRLQDALSLAAVAANSNNQPGFVFALLSTISRFMILPLDALWLFFVWPLKAADGLFNKLGEFVYGRPKQRLRKGESTQPRTRPNKKRDEAFFGRQ